MLQKDKSLFYFLFFYLLIKLYLINLYPINYEYSFIDLSKYFENFDQTILNDYKIINANTIVFSYTIFLFSKILPFLDNLTIGRLLSLSSIFFIIFSLNKIKKFYEIKSNVFTIICLLNPIIWVYSSRVSVDLFPASIIFFSITLLLRTELNKKEVIISAILFLYSVLLKPNFIILLVLPVLIFFFINKISFKNLNSCIKKNFISCIIYISIIFFGFFSYYIYSIYVLGHFISSVNNLYYSKSIFTVLTNSFFYLGLTGIFVAPLFFKNYYFYLKKKLIYVFIIGVLISFYCGYVNPFYFGEMDLGPINFVPLQILQGIFFVIAWALIISIYNYYKILSGKNRNFYCIIMISFFIYVIVISFFRPAQRYIIIFIFFFTSFVFIGNNKQMSLLIPITVLIYIIFNFFFTVNNINRSYLAETSLNYIKINKIYNIVEPGVITDSYNWPSIRRKYNQNKKVYKMVSSLSENSKVKEKFKGKINLINQKEYYLIYND